MKPLAIALVLLPALPLFATQEEPKQRRNQDLERSLERALQRFDKDGDDRVSRNEFPGRPFRFRQMDRNKDGFLDHDDLPGAVASQPADPGPEMDEEALEFFEERIRPVLADNCYRCHATSAKKVRGGLLVDSREALLAGGSTGAAIVPGDADASLLIQAVRYTDEDFEMPPKEQLEPEVVADLERWVEMGAPWPGSALVEADHSYGVDIEAGRQWWSFQAPALHDVPEVADSSWSWSAIDSFLLAEMEEHGVTPVEDADDRAWLRRVSFDLVGLPPTPEEIAAFEGDRSEERYEHVVDRLLASARYGERWGRHWLDVARYAESSGKDSNVVYPHAWRYRDWVIEAFDGDMPYDRFLIEQVAGDLLPAEDEVQRARQTIATGYLAIGAKSHTTRDKRQFAVDVADEQIDSLSQGVLGVTLACARCHDHKFDPFPIEDYYALQGIFQSSKTLYGTVKGNGNRHPSELVQLPESANFPDGLRMDRQVREFLERQEGQARERLDGGMEGRENESEQDARARMRRAREALSTVEAVLARFDENGNPTEANRMAMGVQEGRGRDAQLLARGEIENAGDRVPRGFPQVLRDEGSSSIKRGSGRAELAEWIASEDNPLTARVWVNRVWSHLFGRGLVESQNNFGKSGQMPSHPELLDWLAVTFVDDGWSTKALVRRIVLSHGYHLASAYDSGNAKLDPEAVLLWRMPERRLDAESIRDAMLYAAGTLDFERPQGSPVGLLEGRPRREQVFDYLSQPSSNRSVYLPMLRDRVPEALEVFDAADPSFVTGQREETNVATQALFLMNDKEVLAASDALGKRLLAHEAKDNARIALGFELILGREPSSTERKAVKSFLKDYQKLAKEQADEDEPPQRRRRRARNRTPQNEPELERLTPLEAAWSAFAQSLFQSAEFRYAG
jgi:hypothetical protein